MIAVTRHGKIAVLTLAKGKANTLDIEFCRALTGQFNELKKSPAEAVVITLVETPKTDKAKGGVMFSDMAPR